MWQSYLLSCAFGQLKNKWIMYKPKPNWPFESCTNQTTQIQNKTKHIPIQTKITIQANIFAIHFPQISDTLYGILSKDDGWHIFQIFLLLTFLEHFSRYLWPICLVHLWPKHGPHMSHPGIGCVMYVWGPKVLFATEPEGRGGILFFYMVQFIWRQTPRAGPSRVFAPNFELIN